jgi:hypothetical protein
MNKATVRTALKVTSREMKLARNVKRRDARLAEKSAATSVKKATLCREKRRNVRSAKLTTVGLAKMRAIAKSAKMDFSWKMELASNAI